MGASWNDEEAHARRVAAEAGLRRLDEEGRRFGAAIRFPGHAARVTWSRATGVGAGMSGYALADRDARSGGARSRRLRG